MIDAGLAVGERASERQEEQPHDNRDEVAVIQEGECLVHDVPFFTG